ncbi:Uncharacterised protein [Escherichia coli]|nr:Uncharacterised protein [Escherichia coli]
MLNKLSPLMVSSPSMTTVIAILLTFAGTRSSAISMLACCEPVTSLTAPQEKTNYYKR